MPLFGTGFINISSTPPTPLFNPNGKVNSKPTERPLFDPQNNTFSAPVYKENKEFNYDYAYPLYHELMNAGYSEKEVMNIIHSSAAETMGGKKMRQMRSTGTRGGRGYVQLTGVDNRKVIGDMVGLDLVNNPELGEDPDNAAKIAVAFFNYRKGHIGAKNYEDPRMVHRALAPGAETFEQRQERMKQNGWYEPTIIDFKKPNSLPTDYK